MVKYFNFCIIKTSRKSSQNTALKVNSPKPRKPKKQTKVELPNAPLDGIVDNFIVEIKFCVNTESFLELFVEKLTD